ncbi:MAG: hypothetical protein A2486_16140 [Burkholderiales bacterium RIFOXYC12_FULL_65_23]|uniref:hypothetical protein n=1 Tax=Malikia spinosa TaxID=86180 RepID=UPI0008C51B6F|nr:MAG: hypothetical protein A2486_16140 [Burkholderiales bacterium RIFOXYC12_FULL_65_23]
MSHASLANQSPLPSIEDRVAAIELFLQQLVLLLETEPAITATLLATWTRLAGAHMRRSGSASAQQLAALDRLVEQLT